MEPKLAISYLATLVAGYFVLFVAVPWVFDFLWPILYVIYKLWIYVFQILGSR